LKTFGSVIGVHAPTIRELHDAVIAMSKAAVEEHTTSSNNSNSSSSAKAAASATTGTDTTKQDNNVAAAVSTDAAAASDIAVEAIETIAEQAAAVDKTNGDDSMDVSETTTESTTAVADTTATAATGAAAATTAGAAAVTGSDSKGNDTGKANSSSATDSVAPQCVTSIAARALLSSLHLALLRSVLGRETNGAPNRQVVRAFEMLIGVRESLGEVLNAATWPEVSMLIPLHCLQ
jgi:hypothetical protein